MADTTAPPLVSVIVPAYREAENLPVLIPRLHAALQQSGMSAEVLVVDDNSPDATPEVMAKLAHEYPVRLIVRTAERGLSSAVLRGMHEARGGVLVCMDADLSHPPEKVPELVAAILEQQGDFVIGSRYVAGGKTDDDWGLFRWLNSKVATCSRCRSRPPETRWPGSSRSIVTRFRQLNSLIRSVTKSASN
ncbi:MAG: glycosyltransferase [Planctomycetaceae bacterium]